VKKLYNYVMPRPFNGYNIPIAIQSTYLRDYCKKKKLIFSLPVTELTKSDSYVMFSSLVEERKIKNFGLVSGFVLPIYDLKKLKKLFKKIHNNSKFHLVLENKIFNKKQLLDWAESINIVNLVNSNYN
jgi:sporadic carbohydrate cluster protein (TIGR04323 family)